MAETQQEIVMPIGPDHPYETVLRRAFNEGDLQGQLRVLRSISAEVLRVTLADDRRFVIINVDQFPDADQLDRPIIAERLLQFVRDHWDVIRNATKLVMINSTPPLSLPHSPRSPIDCFWDAYASHATSPGTPRATQINRVIYANIYMDSVAFAHPVNRREGFVNQLRQVRLRTQVRELFEFRSDSRLELERPYNRSYLYPAVIVDAAYSTTHQDILALRNAFYDPNGDELYPNAAATSFIREQCDRPSAENVSALKRQYERKNEAYFPLELDELVKQLLKRFNEGNHRLFDYFTEDQLQDFANGVDLLVPLLMKEFTDVVKNTIEEIETQQELDEYSDDTDQDDDANSRPID